MPSKRFLRVRGVSGFLQKKGKRAEAYQRFAVPGGSKGGGCPPPLLKFFGFLRVLRCNVVLDFEQIFKENYCKNF